MERSESVAAHQRTKFQSPYCVKPHTGVQPRKQTYRKSATSSKIVGIPQDRARQYPHQIQRWNASAAMMQWLWLAKPDI